MPCFECGCSNTPEDYDELVDRVSKLELIETIMACTSEDIRRINNYIDKYIKEK